MLGGGQFRGDVVDVETNGIRLHCALAGESSRTIICLHGFPEYWAAWRPVMAELQTDFRVIAPDQRGYNLSSKPGGIDAYRVKNMIADLHGLAEHFSPGRPFVLAGHDWGAAVAYGYAFAHPERLSHLVVVNGAHPSCLQQAILTDTAQRKASQYIRKLRAPGAAESLAENSYARLVNMLAGFSSTAWMTEKLATEYREAWSQPGALPAMLHWYEASRLVVPDMTARETSAPLTEILSDEVTVSVPHLVIWGEDDRALTPACLADLSRYAPDLAIKRMRGAGHWILHEKPAEVAAAIRAFVAMT